VNILSEEKRTDDLAGQTVLCTDVSNVSDGIVSQDNCVSQGSATNEKKKTKSKWRKKCRVLPPDAKTYSIAVKCYDEQLKYGWDYTKSVIKRLDGFVSPNNTFLDDLQIFAIKHNRDVKLNENDMWLPSCEKPHYHIIMRCKDKKHRYRVLLILTALGIEFRKGVDDELWLNRGVETVGNFSAYATYLTHETEDAIRDGKELYSIDEVVSNLTTDEYLRVRDGYVRVSDACHKITPADLVELDQTAYKLGYDLGDYGQWYSAQPFNVRSHPKMKTVQESYRRGIEAKIAEHMEIVRLCVFIQGKPDTGKTYASMGALSGKRIYPVKSNDTGKFDRLRADHEAIVLDDTTCGNILNITDNYACHVYKRNKDNPVWAGQYFIVTSNDTFEEWLMKSKLVGRPPTSEAWRGTSDEHYLLLHSDVYKAARSRFFLCHIKEENGVNRLYCDDVSKRGSDEDQLKRCKMFVDFKKEFNKIMATYTPKVSKVVDYSEAYC